MESVYLYCMGGKKKLTFWMKEEGAILIFYFNLIDFLSD